MVLNGSIAIQIAHALLRFSKSPPAMLRFRSSADTPIQDMSPRHGVCRGHWVATAT